MKVLHVISTLAPSYGGPAHAVHAMERALTRRGVEVEIATTDDDGPGRRWSPGAPGADANALSQGQARVHRFPKRTDFYKFTPSLATWLRGAVGHYDLVHVHGLFNFVSIAAARAARRAGVPYVIRPYGTLNHYGMTERRPALKRWSVRLLEGPLLRDAAFVHFTAEAERAEAEELLIPMKSVVIPLGIDASLHAPESAFQHFPSLRGRRVVLFLSRISPKKNLEGLLRAFALTCGEVPDLTLLIVGDGDTGYTHSVKALAQQLGIADRVVWAGFLEGERKGAALACAELFVLPSFSENFGIAAVEALMAGVPCVLGTGVAIAHEVASAGAGCDIAPDPQSIAHGMRGILQDAALRAEMAKRAQVLARDRFSVDAMGGHLLDLYARVLGTRDRCDRTAQRPSA